MDRYKHNWNLVWIIPIVAVSFCLLGAWLIYISYDYLAGIAFVLIGIIFGGVAYQYYRIDHPYGWPKGRPGIDFPAYLEMDETSAGWFAGTNRVHNAPAEGMRQPDRSWAWVVVGLIVVIIFIMLLASGCASNAEAQEQGAVAMPTATYMQYSPTPSIDYQATSFIARQTADMAEYNQMMAIVAITQTKEMQEYERAAWDATAVALASTAMAATATRQPTQDAIQAAEQTRTALEIEGQTIAATAAMAAPTQTVAAAEAEAEAKYAGTFVLSQIIFMLTCSALCVVLVLVLRKYFLAEETEENSETEDDQEPAVPAHATVHVIDESNGSLNYTIDDWTGIASDHQLYAVAIGVLVHGKTLAIGNWYGVVEGVQQPFTRAEFEAFLQALVDGIGPDRRKLGIRLASGHVVLTSLGRDYFRQIMDTPPTA